MPTWRSFAEYGLELAALQRDFSEAEIRKITSQMGKEAQAIARIASSHDLGADRSFSGWNRSAPIPLDTVLRNGAAGATILSPTKRTAGPWTVAEQGRNQGNASGFAGPGVNRSTGLTARTKAGNVRKARARRARRWNGVTQGRDTASDAIQVMDRTLPKAADRAVLKVIRRRFDVT